MDIQVKTYSARYPNGTLGNPWEFCDVSLEGIGGVVEEESPANIPAPEGRRTVKAKSASTSALMCERIPRIVSFVVFPARKRI